MAFLICSIASANRTSSRSAIALSSALAATLDLVVAVCASSFLAGRVATGAGFAAGGGGGGCGGGFPGPQLARVNANPRQTRFFMAPPAWSVDTVPEGSRLQAPRRPRVVGAPPLAQRRNGGTVCPRRRVVHRTVRPGRGRR